MRFALLEAQTAADCDEVPVGAVIVRNGDIIAAAHNTVESARSSLCHAELAAIQQALNVVGDKRLTDCVLYVTLEPCAMCAGACVNARLGAIAFGAYDLAAGACGSVTDIVCGALGGVRIPTVGGIMRVECAELLSSYFEGKR